MGRLLHDLRAVVALLSSHDAERPDAGADRGANPAGVSPPGTGRAGGETMDALRTIPLEADLLERLLAPYKPGCRYLLEATLGYPTDGRAPFPDDPSSWVAARGRFAIPSSCYVDATGHLNAVEFNIAYDQLCYAAL